MSGQGEFFPDSEDSDAESSELTNQELGIDWALMSGHELESANRRIRIAIGIPPDDGEGGGLDRDHDHEPRDPSPKSGDDPAALSVEELVD